MKKMFVIIGVTAVALLAVFISGCSSFKKPPKPEITHGEFPFHLTYELDGQIFEVDDTLMCDFDGYGANAAKMGMFRIWKSSLANGDSRITLYKDDEIEVYYSPNINHWEAGAFYMGDTEIYDAINTTFPNACYKKDYNDKSESSYIISAEDMWEKYKLRLISWEIAPPIENKFK